MRGHARCISTHAGFRPPKAGAFHAHGWNLELASPVAVREAWHLHEVLPLLAACETAAAQGLYVALAVAYEAAPAFDPALKVRPGCSVPFVWAAFHEAPGTLASPQTPASLSDWRPHVSRQEYARALATIKAQITAGESYQVNYTMPCSALLDGCPRSLFLQLAFAQGAGFCAWFDMGRRKVLSLSPELFFLRRGEAVVVRPMKGTAPRGRFPAEDEALARKLEKCEKNRAENVMIVDLLRNDLGRIARPGTVAVRRLFQVERFATVLQMTSTVTAQLPKGVGLPELFSALFPCGSVTGAPKIRTMEIIASLEQRPRGYYCGALGFLLPGGDAVFNVPIRTMTVDSASSQALFHVGGGITHDSQTTGEYQECLDKMAFLRGAGRGFRLLETLLLANGRYMLPEAHLQRLAASATRLGFRFDAAQVRRGLAEAARKRPFGRYMLRLLLGQDGGLETDVRELPPDSRPWRVALAQERVDPHDQLLFHKTDNRGWYEARQKEHPECDEVLLCNRHGQLTEGCRSNLVVQMDGRRLTPALHCGLLPGVFRGHLLQRGVIQEAELRPEDLHAAQAVWCVNSVRGWRRVLLDAGVRPGRRCPARRPDA